MKPSCFQTLWSFSACDLVALKHTCGAHSPGRSKTNDSAHDDRLQGAETRNSRIESFSCRLIFSQPFSDLFLALLLTQLDHYQSVEMEMMDVQSSCVRVSTFLAYLRTTIPEAAPHRQLKAETGPPSRSSSGRGVVLQGGKSTRLARPEVRLYEITKAEFGVWEVFVRKFQAATASSFRQVMDLGRDRSNHEVSVFRHLV